MTATESAESHSSDARETAASTSRGNKLIRLNEQDNVLICCQSIRSGEVLYFNEIQLRIRKPIEVGHKIALIPISAGQRIVRFGVPIGSATRAIEAGEHVHTQNLRGDYMLTHNRDNTTAESNRN